LKSNKKWLKLLKINIVILPIKIMLFNKIITPAIGAILLSLTLISQPAKATNLSLVSTQDTPIPPAGWDDLGWIVEGRAGVKGKGDWEVKLSEYQYDPIAQKENHVNPLAGDTIDWDWQNGVDVPWLLEWDGNKVKYTFGNKPTIDYVSNTGLPLDAFYLWTRATTTTSPNLVGDGTEMLLKVTGVKEVGATSFTIVSGVESSAVAPITNNVTNITKNWFVSDKPIAALQGIARMSWDLADPNPNQKNARSRVGFKIVGFDLEESTSVPEPGVIFGLLAVGLSLAKTKKIKDS
jgi:hypothetical protein